jgi:hypothetical protein
MSHLTKRDCGYCGEPFEYTSNTRTTRRDACDECIKWMRIEGVYFTQQPADPTVYRPRYGLSQFVNEKERG